MNTHTIVDDVRQLIARNEKIQHSIAESRTTAVSAYERESLDYVQGMVIRAMQLNRVL